MHTLIIGAGYSGLRIGRDALEHGSVCGTRREQQGLDELQHWGLTGCIVNGELTTEFVRQLQHVTHLVVSVAPARKAPLNDPILSLLGTLIRRDVPCLKWVGYLSTIGVYGDHGGEWVDEKTPCTSTQVRSIVRREAELAWQQWGHELDLPNPIAVSILRLSGIYGPGKNAVEDALIGRARMLIKPDQVFNRIHVDDLANATIKAGLAEYDGILNITDDLPAAPQDVIRYAHQLTSQNPPQAIAFESADISDMARSFYSENKRVSNAMSKEHLALQYRYPTYKAALDTLWKTRQ